LGIHRIAIPGPLLARGDALRAFRLARYCRAHAAEYDLLISAYNILDFGRAGLQYISDFSFSDPVRRALLQDQDIRKSAPRPAGPGRRAYLALARGLAGQRKNGWKRNLTLANSQWTRGILADVFGVEAETVYPPVAGVGGSRPWPEREDGFVSVGRIVPEKNIPAMLEILDGVREKTGALHYHVLGQVPDGSYGRAVLEDFRARADWAALEGPVFGKAKDDRLAGHKFGLAGCRHEAFGIAVAEMVRAGMIVWVPEGGGQVEIVDHPELIYKDAADAAAKIERVMRSPERQAALLSHLARRSAIFSAKKFMDEMRAAAARFLETHGIEHA
jgi:glycosyltransferase involved in cell wall biosynthesis